VRASESDNRERERASEHARTYLATAFGRLANATRTMRRRLTTVNMRDFHMVAAAIGARISLSRGTVLRFHDNEAHDEEFY